MTFSVCRTLFVSELNGDDGCLWAGRRSGKAGRSAAWVVSAAHDFAPTLELRAALLPPRLTPSSSQGKYTRSSRAHIRTRGLPCLFCLFSSPLIRRCSSLSNALLVDPSLRLRPHLSSLLLPRIRDLDQYRTVYVKMVSSDLSSGLDMCDGG